MASGWHFQEDATPTPGEVEAMVAVLEGRHGAWAADVAEFFSTLHSLKGDAGRSWAWAGVAEMVRRRAEARLGEQCPVTSLIASTRSAQLGAEGQSSHPSQSMAGQSRSLTLHVAEPRASAAPATSAAATASARAPSAMPSRRFSVRIASAGILYLSQVVLARWMGAFEYGIYVFVWTWVLVLSGLSHLGLPTLMIRLVPEYLERGEHGAAARAPAAAAAPSPCSPARPSPARAWC